MDFDTSPAQHQQYDRDLRGPAQDHKRHKDSTTKWSRGHMALPGLRWDWANDSPFPGDESSDNPQEMKVRPLRVNPLPSRYKPHHNVVKVVGTGRGNHYLPSQRLRSKVGIAEEMMAAAKDSDGSKDMPPSSPGVGVNDPFLYSFDPKATTPGRPLSLDVFVKQPTARDTERLVEREYEVVDENGLAVKGKRAKRELRKRGSAGLGGETVRVDDDGFELV